MGSLNPENDPKQVFEDSGYVQDDSLLKEVAVTEMPCTANVELLDLSDDVLLYVLQYLTPRDLKALGFTCSRLGALVLDRTLWQRVDARSQPCGRHRMTWLLTHALSHHTTALRLTGYAREAIGCEGYMHNPHCSQNGEDSDVSNGRVYHLTGQSRFGNRVSYWPEPPPNNPYDPAPTGQNCPGPQITLTTAALHRITQVCTNLTDLALDYCVIDNCRIKITMFPQTIKKLSLRGTRCFNVEKSFLYKIQDRLVCLEDLDVSECDWIDPACLLPLSKMPRLARLLMTDCHRMSEFVAYASLSTRYGFKALKVLDFRRCPVGDSEVSALGWLPQLEELHLSAATREPHPAPHAHCIAAPPPPHAELEPWEEQEPEYYKSKYAGELWIHDELNQTSRSNFTSPNDSIRPPTNLERLIAEPVVTPPSNTRRNVTMQDFNNYMRHELPPHPLFRSNHRVFPEMDRMNIPHRDAPILPRIVHPTEVQGSGANSGQGDQNNAAKISDSDQATLQVCERLNQLFQRNTDALQNQNNNVPNMHQRDEVPQRNEQPPLPERDGVITSTMPNVTQSNQENCTQKTDKPIVPERDESTPPQREVCAQINDQPIISTRDETNSPQINPENDLPMLPQRDEPAVPHVNDQLNQLQRNEANRPQAMNSAFRRVDELELRQTLLFLFNPASRGQTRDHDRVAQMNDRIDGDEPLSPAVEEFFNYLKKHRILKRRVVACNGEQAERSVNGNIEPNNVERVNQNTPKRKQDTDDEAGPSKRYKEVASTSRVIANELRLTNNESGLSNTGPVSSNNELGQSATSNKCPVNSFSNNNSGSSSNGCSSMKDHCATKAARKYYNDHSCQVSRSLLQDALNDFKKRTEDSSGPILKPNYISQDITKFIDSDDDASLGDDDEEEGSPQPKRSRVAANRSTFNNEYNANNEPSTSSTQPSTSSTQPSTSSTQPSTSSTQPSTPSTQPSLTPMSKQNDNCEEASSQNNGSNNASRRKYKELFGKSTSNNALLMQPSQSSINPSTSSTQPNMERKPPLVHLKKNENVFESSNNPTNAHLNNDSGNNRANTNANNNNDVRQNEGPMVEMVPGPSSASPYLRDSDRNADRDASQQNETPRHRVLCINVGRYQTNDINCDMNDEEVLAALLPESYRYYLHSANLTARLRFSSLVTDAAIRRFGRADGENINYVQIGGLPYDDPHARPNRSNLRILTATGFRNITNLSLGHLATAAPNLEMVDFTDTRVTEAGVQNFRSLRPDCTVKYGTFETPKEDGDTPDPR